MEKPTCNDIATFPELFSGMDQFIEEFGQGIKRASFRLALLVIPGAMLVLFILARHN
jgi:hypothetical protein